MRRDVVDGIFETVTAIAASNVCYEYIIGFTGRAIKDRHSDYRRCGFKHIVALRDRLSMNDALDLEHELQERVKMSDRRKLVYQRYCSYHIEDGNRRSTGGKSDSGELNHVVYMTWREERWED